MTYDGQAQLFPAWNPGTTLIMNTPNDQTPTKTSHVAAAFQCQEPTDAKRAELTAALSALWEATKETRNISSPEGDPIPLLFAASKGQPLMAYNVSTIIGLSDRGVMGMLIQEMVANHEPLPATATLMAMAYMRKAAVDGGPIGEREECLMMHMETADGYCADLVSCVERRENGGPIFGEPEISVRGSGFQATGALANFYGLAGRAAAREGVGKTKQ